jgi:predicted nucleic acid-binding protein
MKSIESVKRVFLDTAPLIYFVEGNDSYLDSMRPVFERVDQGLLCAVTSPITLAECLVLPLRKGQPELARSFLEQIIHGANTTFVTLNHEIACKAAELRAHYNLTLDDAFQVAGCLASGCDAFLTNDRDLRRVDGLRVIVLDEVKPC